RPAARASRWCFAFRGPRSGVQRVVGGLGRGRAEALRHGGAWKALLEAGLPPSHIVGTSMGAVIGAALAAGSTSQRILDIALSLQKKDFAALDAWSLAKGVFAGNILKPEPLKRTIARLVPATRNRALQRLGLQDIPGEHPLG